MWTKLLGPARCLGGRAFERGQETRQELAAVRELPALILKQANLRAKFRMVYGRISAGQNVHSDAYRDDHGDGDILRLTSRESLVEVGGIVRTSGRATDEERRHGRDIAESYTRAG